MTGRKCNSFFRELGELLKKNGISFKKSTSPNTILEFEHNDQRFVVTKLERRNRRNKKTHYIKIERQRREDDGEYGRPEWRTTSTAKRAWKELGLEALLQDFRAQPIRVIIFEIY